MLACLFLRPIFPSPCRAASGTSFARALVPPRDAKQAAVVKSVESASFLARAGRVRGVFAGVGALHSASLLSPRSHAWSATHHSI